MTTVDDLSKACAAMELLRIYMYSESDTKHLEFESAIKDHTAPSESDAVTVPRRRLERFRCPLYHFSVTRAHRSRDGQVRSR
jgi:hypothetical protein